MDNELEHQTISEAELKILHVIWAMKQATAQEISERLCEKNQWDPSTVKTFLFRLGKKGVLRTEKQGRCFLYFPNLSEQEVLQRHEIKLLENVRENMQGQIIKDLIQQITFNLDEGNELIELIHAKLNNHI